MYKRRGHNNKPVKCPEPATEANVDLSSQTGLPLTFNAVVLPQKLLYVCLGVTCSLDVLHVETKPLTENMRYSAAFYGHYICLFFSY